MAREDLIPVDGTVIDVFAGGKYAVRLENGKTVTAKLSGKLRVNQIRVILGDRVTVGLSPYDLTNGIITARERVQSHQRS